MQFSDFFNFRGRLNRKAYWMMYLVMWAVLILVGVVAYFISTLLPTLGIIVIAVPFIAFFVASIAITLRRLHDRNKSGWWLLGYYIVPSIFSSLGDAAGGIGILFSVIGLILSVVAFVDIGCLKGTQGPNQYGPDPLGVGADPAVFE